MNRRLGGDASLNAPISNDGEAGEWQDWLTEDSASQETMLAEGEESSNRHKALVSALAALNERERRIFEARRLTEDPITLEDLAQEFGISRERVRQIEVRAFEKVQDAVKSEKPHCQGGVGRDTEYLPPRAVRRAGAGSFSFAAGTPCRGLSDCLRYCGRRRAQSPTVSHARETPNNIRTLLLRLRRADCRSVRSRSRLRGLAAPTGAYLYFGLS